MVCGCGLDSSGIGYGVVVDCSENGNTFWVPYHVLSFWTKREN